MKSHKLPFVLAISLLSLSAAACGSSSTPHASPSTSTSSPVSQLSSTALTPPLSHSSAPTKPTLAPRSTQSNSSIKNRVSAPVSTQPVITPAARLGGTCGHIPEEGWTVYANENTSCTFAMNMANAVSAWETAHMQELADSLTVMTNQPITAYSPTLGKNLTMICSWEPGPNGGFACTGGVNAKVWGS